MPTRSLARRPPRLAARAPLALLALLATLVPLVTAAPAAAAPAVEAHRGGSYIEGVPRYGENTMPAFRHSWNVLRTRLETDVYLTQDRVPVLMHDQTLDRTTNCTGPVSDYTAARLRRECRVDVLGSPDSTLRSRHTSRGAPVPTLRELLDFARRTGATLNIELKSIPNVETFPLEVFVDRVVATIRASRVPLRQLNVQSFFAPNLERFMARMPTVRTALLIIEGIPADGAIAAARDLGVDIIAPSYPISRSYVREANAAGFRVVVYTLNFPREVRGARAIAVNGVISDDPTMALRVLGQLPRPRPTPFTG